MDRKRSLKARGCAAHEPARRAEKQRDRVCGTRRTARPHAARGAVVARRRDDHHHANAGVKVLPKLSTQPAPRPLATGRRGWLHVSMSQPHEPTAVIGYCRVSTIEQAESGISLDAQRHRLQAYADAHALALVRVETDAGLSARRTSNRPALQRALLSLKRGEATGLVAVKLDRLSRTTSDVLDLVARAEREHWALHSIDERLDTSSAQGRFVTTILAAMAQLEREQIVERTMTAMAELRRQGKRISGKPQFGFRFEEGLVVEVPGEQEILRRIRTLADQGKRCFAVASTLNREGVVNPRTGREWHFGTMRSVMRTAALA